jgi:CubicO group peptidase (beta-lactamase class C family)
MKTRLALALGATSSALLLGACGGSAGSHPASSSNHTKDPTGSSVSLPQQYADCMRAHGIHSFPNPVDGHLTLSPSSGVNPSSSQFKGASSACAKYGPSGGGAPGSTARATPTTSNGTSAAAEVPATWRGYGAWLAQRAAAGQFSGAVLVADSRRELLDAGYSLADRVTRTANTPQTRFCIASIGKLFTAVAIAQLAQQHKLSFDAPAGDYLTGLAPAIGEHVTIANLLDMTSGLGNTVLGRRNPPRTLARMVALIARERPHFTPGARFRYSNDGYVLLGAVIQDVSGETYSNYIREHVFQPAEMTHTAYRVYTPAQVAGMAHGYALTGSSLQDISNMPQIANPSGGAYSTVGDLLNFARALLDHRMLGAAMTRTILTPRVNSPQPGGPPVDKYTYGFSYQQLSGVTFVGHNGGTPGYEGEIDIYPHTGNIVIVLTNQDQTMVPAIQQSEALITGASQAS